MNTDKRSFSIIMNVYDQAQELESNLPSILSLKYEPGYEVIVVDETSTDNTEEVLKLMKKEYSHLYMTFLPKPNRLVVRKKMALHIGSKASKYDWLILSKIDKVPSNEDLLESINEELDESADLTLGYITKKGVRLQPFYLVSDASKHIRKAERKLKTVRTRNYHTHYLFGRYDFIIINKSHYTDVLSFYEHEIPCFKLFFIRLGIIWQNLIKRHSTTFITS